jgi:hypothetical protein
MNIIKIHFKFGIVFLFLFSFISSSGQQLKSFYKSLYKADSLVQTGSLLAAEKLYLSNEKDISDVGLLDRDIASICIRLKDFKKAEYYINKAVNHGVDIDRLNGNPFVKTYLASINYMQNSPEYLKNRRLYNCNVGYPDQRIEILQMHERDQAVRDLIANVDPKIFNKLVYQVDSTNYDELKGIIKNIGFPGYNEVGLDGEFDMLDLMLHIPIGQINDKKEFDALDSLMLKQVLKGNFSPLYYALIVDRYSYVKFQAQVFGTYWEYDRVKKARVITSIRNIKDVDSLRATIFLPPLTLSKKQGFLLPNDYNK